MSKIKPFLITFIVVCVSVAAIVRIPKLRAVVGL